MDLIVADLHFTDNPKDSYRWDLFPWLQDQIRKYEVDRLIVLGDLTEKKDKHTGITLTRVKDEFITLSKLCGVIIIKGNHDYDNEDYPSFGFLGDLSNITYVNKPLVLGKELFLPHSNDFNYYIETFSFENFDFIYLHQPFTGALVSENYELQKGFDPSVLDAVSGRVFAGDIHIPQTIGNIIYVGSPYPIDFGDSYQGRVILVDNQGDYKSLNYTSINKYSLRLNSVGELEELFTEEGDQFKIVIVLQESEYHEWGTIRRQVKDFCSNRQLFLHSVTLEPINKKSRKRSKRRKSAVIQKSDSHILREFSTAEKLNNYYITEGEFLIES